MKSHKFVAVVVAGLVMLGLGTTLTRAHTSGDQVCPRTGVTHVVTVENGYASPQNTYGQLCDKLMIINKDKIAREMAFGLHEKHIPYDGVTERVLRPGKSLTITFVQAGLFHFHDHDHDDSAGFFTVSH